MVLDSFDNFYIQMTVCGLFIIIIIIQLAMSLPLWLLFFLEPIIKSLEFWDLIHADMNLHKQFI